MRERKPLKFGTLTLKQSSECLPIWTIIQHNETPKSYNQQSAHTFVAEVAAVAQLLRVPPPVVLDERDPLRCAPYLCRGSLAPPDPPCHGRLVS